MVELLTKLLHRNPDGRKVDLMVGKNTIIEDGVIIGLDVSIGHNCIIKKGTQIEDDVTFGNNCIIGDDCYISDKVVLQNNVKLCKRVLLLVGVFIAEKSRLGFRTIVFNGASLEYNTITSSKVMIGELATIISHSRIYSNSVIDKLCVVNGVIGKNVFMHEGAMMEGRSVVKSGTKILAHTTVKPLSALITSEYNSFKCA